MDNKQYLETLIANYIAQNKTKEGLKEYLMQVSKMLIPEQKEDNTPTQSKVHQKKFGVGTVTGGLDMYPEHHEQNSIFNQQGIVNFLMLGFITLFFEVFFILISLCIY